jgi:hypothetical protein
MPLFLGLSCSGFANFVPLAGWRLIKVPAAFGRGNLSGIRKKTIKFLPTGKDVPVRTGKRMLPGRLKAHYRTGGAPVEAKAAQSSRFQVQGSRFFGP